MFDTTDIYSPHYLLLFLRNVYFLYFSQFFFIRILYVLKTNKFVGFFLSSCAFGIEAFVSEAFRIAYYHCRCCCCYCCCSTVLIRKPIIFNAVYRCCFCFLPSRHRNKKKWKVTRKESDFCSLANKDRTMRTLCMGNIVCILYSVQCTATKVYVYMCSGIRTECCAVMWCAVLCAVCSIHSNQVESNTDDFVWLCARIYNFSMCTTTETTAQRTNVICGIEWRKLKMATNAKQCSHDTQAAHIILEKTSIFIKVKIWKNSKNHKKPYFKWVYGEIWRNQC